MTFIRGNNGQITIINLIFKEMKKIIISAIILSLGIIGFTSCNDEFEKINNNQDLNLKTTTYDNGVLINLDSPCDYSRHGNCLTEVVITAAADRLILDEFSNSLKGDYQKFVEDNLFELSNLFEEAYLNDVIKGNMIVEYHKNESSLEFFIFKDKEEVARVYPFTTK